MMEEESASYARTTLDIGEGVRKEERVAIVKGGPGKEQRRREEGEAAEDVHEAAHGRVPHSLATVKAKYLERGRHVNRKARGRRGRSKCCALAEKP
jgi:hypothetical protein